MLNNALDLSSSGVPGATSDNSENGDPHRLSVLPLDPPLAELGNGECSSSSGSYSAALPS